MNKMEGFKWCFFMFLIILVSCTPAKEKEVTSEATKDSVIAKNNSISSVMPGCYLMISGKDSATMNLSVNGNEVSGDLIYNRFEKDDNKGTFAGKITDSTLEGWYTYQSEGKSSVKQIIFKIAGNTFLEGYGDINLSGDSAYFKYPHTLVFEDKYAYARTDCK